MTMNNFQSAHMDLCTPMHYKKDVHIHIRVYTHAHDKVSVSLPYYMMNFSCNM